MATRELLPGSEREYIMVYFREGQLIRLPSSAVKEPKIGHQTCSKLTRLAIEDLVSVARSFGLVDGDLVSDGDDKGDEHGCGPKSMVEHSLRRTPGPNHRRSDRRPSGGAR